MKNLRLKKSLVFIMSLVIASGSLLAHSGRTDSSGGHKDNKNKSGLGSYHYHCDGYPAHLHSKGVCPYKPSTSNDTTIKPSSTTKITSKPTYVEKEQTFVIDGKSVKVNTINVNNTNLVELKTLCEELEIAMSYDVTTKAIECKKGNTSFTLRIDSTNFWLDGDLSTLNVAPIAHNGRTMIPARVIAETIGKTVTYDSTSNNIIIN